MRLRDGAQSRKSCPKGLCGEAHHLEPHIHGARQDKALHLDLSPQHRLGVGLPDLKIPLGQRNAMEPRELRELSVTVSMNVRLHIRSKITAGDEGEARRRAVEHGKEILERVGLLGNDDAFTKEFGAVGLCETDEEIQDVNIWVCDQGATVLPMQELDIDLEPGAPSPRKAVELIKQIATDMMAVPDLSKPINPDASALIAGCHLAVLSRARDLCGLPGFKSPLPSADKIVALIERLADTPDEELGAYGNDNAGDCVYEAREIMPKIDPENWTEDGRVAEPEENASDEPTGDDDASTHG